MLVPFILVCVHKKLNVIYDFVNVVFFYTLRTEMPDLPCFIFAVKFNNGCYVNVKQFN